MDEKKSKRPKVRKTWARNPTEQVVQSEKGKVHRPPPRKLMDEAIDEFEEFGK